MTPKVFLAAEMIKRAASYEMACDCDSGPRMTTSCSFCHKTAAMLRQAADADARWAQLKAWLAFVDFPTAWRIVNETDAAQHHEKCSFRVGERGVLCDCVGIDAAMAARKDVAAYMARIEGTRA